MVATTDATAANGGVVVTVCDAAAANGIASIGAGGTKEVAVTDCDTASVVASGMKGVAVTVCDAAAGNGVASIGAGGTKEVAVTDCDAAANVASVVLGGTKGVEGVASSGSGMLAAAVVDAPTVL